MPAPRVTDRPLLATSDPPRHEACWAKTTKDGKPGISVRDHCLNVGCVAEAHSALLPHLAEIKGKAMGYGLLEEKCIPIVQK
jgi:hypothetical protein